MRTAPDVLSMPTRLRPDPDEFVRAAMEWHFSPDTGSPYWLHRARSLDFDPRTDVRTQDDLRLFPNLVNELRNVPVMDLVPRGYGGDPEIAGVFESGGTTGAAKRVVCMRDWLDHVVGWCNANLDAHGFPRGAQWLGVTPTGPHIVGRLFERSAVTHGRFGMFVDLDPRWVKRLIADGRGQEARAYTDHVLEQVTSVLRTQDIGVMAVTPALLERLVERDELVDLVNEKVRAIRWGGTHMDEEARQFYRTEVFPDTALYGHYGSTMVLGIAVERPAEQDDGPCVFDPFSPYNTFTVVDPVSGQRVAIGERGQVVMHHVSRALLIPNNLERDTAVRVGSLPDAVGDAVATVEPVRIFDDGLVIEGVY